ncbi:MAG TPA: carboxypeptidase-like regulatory domain-containing protein, partial [Chitinophagaceae bacterium]|nr:carboxypeptidase-like regulatory domain-containing protein [Chitinophagaceae bacterium]
MLLAVLTTAAVWAQQRTVKGKVTDAKGVPMAGATVSVKGSTTATQTDAQGNFSIPAAQGNTLVVSNVGFGTQEVKVGASDNISVTMQVQGGELSEVVVTALGQTRGRDKVGYAASTFKSEDVVRSAPVSALDGLQGRVAGADISTIGGQPGSSSKIILRGYSSIGQTSNNQALIVVDGVPFNNSRLGSFNDFLNSGGVDCGNGLNDINPN